VVDSLRATVPALVSLVTGSPISAFRRRPGPSEWDAATVMSHMADAEMAYGLRLRTALAQPGGILAAYDENAWAARFGPLDDDPNKALARFRALRDNTIAIVESIADHEWTQVGLHEEFGEVSVAELVDRIVAHDAGHLDQIRTALAN
jgi:DinB family protein